MNKLTALLICLLLTARLSAVHYEPLRGSGLPASALPRATYSAPATDFRSTSPYGGTMQPSGSLSGISASNFKVLNSEGGACFSPESHTSAPRRTPRPDGSGGSGVVDTHSPVGETPWLLCALLALAYTLRKVKRTKNLFK